MALFRFSPSPTLSTSEPSKAARRPSNEYGKYSLEFIGFTPNPGVKAAVKVLLDDLMKDFSDEAHLQAHFVAMRGDTIEVILDLDFDYESFHATAVGTNSIRLTRAACAKVRGDLDRWKREEEEAEELGATE